jgi:hypothetical protein
MSEKHILDNNSLPPFKGNENFVTLNLGKLSLTEISRLINIQSNLRDLGSKQKDKVEAALNSLSSLVSTAHRKDALYALVGYYKIEVNSADEIIAFFEGTRIANSTYLSLMILNDIVKFKEVARRTSFIRDCLPHFKNIIEEANEDTKEAIRNSIINAVWGDKLKRKFLEVLFYEYNDDDLF